MAGVRAVQRRSRGRTSYDETGFWAREPRARPSTRARTWTRPRHVVPGGAAVADIPAADLVRPAVRIDARALCDGDPAWVLEAADVEAWEAEHGRVPERRGGAAVHRLGRLPRRRARYLGDPLDFPGYGADAAALLVERGAPGWASTRSGSTPGHAPESPVHHLSLPAGLWHLEGLVGLDAVPATGATLVVGALQPAGCVRHARARVRPAAVAAGLAVPLTSDGACVFNALVN